MINFDDTLVAPKPPLPIRVRGSGGGKGGSVSHDPNTYKSNARARLIEAIGEGPILGLVNGAKSIYFDQTALMNADNTEAFKGVVWSEHKGSADEGYFNGHSAVETPVSVEVQVKTASGPVVRTIVDENADAVRVIMRIPALVRQDENGGLKKTSVSYAIDVRANNGSWTTAVVNNLNNQKALSPFQVAHRVELPAGGSPWDVRVRRITDDSNDDKHQKDTYWEGYVVLVEGKFTYPFTAAVAMEVNAEEMGSSIPPRGYHVKGLLINVPSNYDPDTRAYTGVWDGSFKIAWTNNPAWVFYDLIVNDRYGLGEFISPEIVDKWSLYTVAQYCDQLVPSGYRNGDTGEIILEPRFTYNGVINSRDQAFFVLQSITQAWRGMAYWALGQVFATADMPGDPARLVTPANVIGGDFEYSGTAIKARHSVVMVKWNDPADFYRPATEIVIDTALLNKYGWREKTVQLRGCTSRGLAHRYGKWIIDTEQHETDTLTYSASWDHAELRPGEIISVSDPRKAQIRAGGRIVSHDDLIVRLDDDFDATENETYSLLLTMPSGAVERRAILAFMDKRTVRVASAFSDTAAPDAVWTVTGSDIVPRNYRVLSVDETEPNIFKITALFHDPLKYERVEKDIIFEPLPYERASKTSRPPSDLRVAESGYVLDGITYNTLTLSWTPPQNLLVRGYVIAVDTPNDGSFTLGTTQNSYIDLSGANAGEYKFYVQTLNYAGILSEAATIEYEALGPAGFPLPTVTDLELADGSGGKVFSTLDLKVRWKSNFAATIHGSPTNDVSPHFSFCTVDLYHGDTGQLLRSVRTYQEEYAYSYEFNKADCAALGLALPARRVRVEVKVSDIFGRNSDPVFDVFTNPVPAAIAPSHVVNGTTINLSFVEPQDLDYAGYILFRSETPGIDVTSAEPYYVGRSIPLAILGEPRTTYYFKIAAFDWFGRDDLNYSSEFQIATLSDGADIDPPATPTGLEVASELVGNGRSRLLMTWNENTEDDFAGYDIQIRRGSSGFVGYATTSANFEIEVVSGSTYQVRVRARDKAGNLSPYTDALTHTAAKDTTPPAPPTELTIDVGLTSLWLSWKNAADEDLSYVEILEGLSDDPEQAQLIARANGNSFARTGLANEVQRFYWLRSVDTSENRSVLTAHVSAVTARLPEAKRLQIVGLTLNPNTPEENSVSWPAFSITYGVPGMAPATQNVLAGSLAWTAGSLYLYYVEGESVLRSTDSVGTIFVQSGHPIAVYRGGTDIQLANGETVIDGANIITGTIGANQLVVNSAIITDSLQLADAVVTSAKIEELDAAKLKAGSAIAGSIVVGDAGNSLETIRDQAAAPADTINNGVTLIDPGKILIADDVTLNDWRAGGSSTEINGGAVAANSIKANSLVIGLRGLTIDGLTFEHNHPGPNQVSWTAGSIAYVDDDGSSATAVIGAGSASWTADLLYLYWERGTSSIAATTMFAEASGDNRVILANYRGGSLLFAAYGRTIIDGGLIKTQSIETEQMKVGSVTADVIAVQSLSAISADLGAIEGGSLNINDRFIVTDTGKLTVRSAATGPRLVIESNRIIMVDDT